GCNTTAWIKAKPEWAKGSRLIRFTPRLNPDINGYWMCDIGRFDYHWIEGDARVSKPLERAAHGNDPLAQQPVTWSEPLSKLRDRLAEAGRANPEGVRFLLSAHASHEEFFLFRRLAEELIGDNGPNAIAISWRRTVKQQTPTAKFQVPDVDAPNVNGARICGFAAGQVGDPVGDADRSSLRADVEAGRVAALYVFDPGPDGTIGDVTWIADARRRGTLPLLIVQGVLLTELARAADFVLPGASYVEKEASYTNEQGRLQGTARAINPPGEAQEDWQVIVNVGVALGVPFNYTASAHVRADIAARYGEPKGLEGLTTLAFAQPMHAKSWLQSSNPSERWKWEFMYQDLPPVKFDGEPFSTNFEGVIPLKEVK